MFQDVKYDYNVYLTGTRDVNLSLTLQLEKLYRSTLVIPPPVNPPNSLICQNITERIHSYVKTTR